MKSDVCWTQGPCTIKGQKFSTLKRDITCTACIGAIKTKEMAFAIKEGARRAERNQHSR